MLNRGEPVYALLVTGSNLVVQIQRVFGVGAGVALEGKRTLRKLSHILLQLAPHKDGTSAHRHWHEVEWSIPVETLDPSVGGRQRSLRVLVGEPAAAGGQVNVPIDATVLDDRGNQQIGYTFMSSRSVRKSGRQMGRPVCVHW